jgi:hypothetical protein
MNSKGKKSKGKCTNLIRFNFFLFSVFASLVLFVFFVKFHLKIPEKSAVDPALKLLVQSKAIVNTKKASLKI